MPPPRQTGTAGRVCAGGALPNKFTGSFNGSGDKISGLYINPPSQNYTGLFGFASTGSSITNVGLVSEMVTGEGYVAGLVGENWGTVSNSYAIGNITGSTSTSGDNVGGLVGFLNTNAFVSHSYASGSVRGASQVGGLVGNNWGTVSNSHATGNVTGSSGGANVGGLVGFVHEGGVVSTSYATGGVTGFERVGGIVGEGEVGTTISNCYATGSVSLGASGNSVGGLVGEVYGSAVSNSYATGNVTGGGGDDVGGLVGVP